MVQPPFPVSERAVDDAGSVGRPDRRAVLLRRVERESRGRAPGQVRHPDVTAVSIVAVGGDALAVGREIDPAVIARRSHSLNLLPLTIEPGHLQTSGGSGAHTVGEDAVVGNRKGCKALSHDRFNALRDRERLAR